MPFGVSLDASVFTGGGTNWNVRGVAVIFTDPCVCREVGEARIHLVLAWRQVGK